MTSDTRKVTEISLDADLLMQARDLDIDPTLAAERGIAGAVKAERERLWLLENADAIKAYNDDIETNGLPLAEFRQF